MRVVTAAWTRHFRDEGPTAPDRLPVTDAVAAITHYVAKSHD